jgi:FtsH-binding integral membrane protein
LANPYQVPVAEAAVDARVEFLRKVGGMTFLGLVFAGIASMVSMAAVISIPALQNQWVSLGVMLGAIFGARFVGDSLVNQPDRSTQLAGFAVGTGLQGIAMGYLMLAAVLLSIDLYSNPVVVLGQALGLVGLTVVGMVAYLLSGPKNLSMIGGAMAALSLPMLALMVISFVFPIGGPFGILLSLLFVGLSAGGLLFNLNQVMHQMSTDRVIPAAYHVTLGMLVLFWNVLSLLMRLQRR